MTEQEILAQKTYDLPEIYKKTSTGKTQTWYGCCVNDTIYVRTGYQGMKLTWTAGKKCTPKNEGKANASTAVEQAMAELDSMCAKKLARSGYSATVAATTTDNRIYPMLAKKYKDNPKWLKLPCAFQRKYDGLCCMAHVKVDSAVGDAYTYPIVEDVYTRSGVMFSPDIHAAFIGAVQGIDNLPFSEIYMHGELYSETVPFQELVSILRSNTLSTEELKLFQDNVSFYWYDAYLPSWPNLVYSDRYELIKNTCSMLSSKFIKPVGTYILNDVSKIKEYHDLFVSEGYEGLMLRNLDSEYKVAGRSSDLLKFKEFDDNEFEIVGYEEGLGKEAGHIIWQCKTESGDIFKARPTGSSEYRRKLFIACETDVIDYTKCLLTVRYFGLTDSGLPRHPVAIGVRFDV